MTLVRIVLFFIALVILIAAVLFAADVLTFAVLLGSVFCAACLVGRRLLRTSLRNE